VVARDRGLAVTMGNFADDGEDPDIVEIEILSSESEMLLWDQDIAWNQGSGASQKAEDWTRR
jgi:hypothetical protein